MNINEIETGQVLRISPTTSKAYGFAVDRILARTDGFVTVAGYRVNLSKGHRFGNATTTTIRARQTVALVA